jgi:hypothetical protein
VTQPRRPASYDLVVVVGNVKVLLAEHTERLALQTLSPSDDQDYAGWVLSARTRPGARAPRG